jgi:hypothetical protein
MFLFPTFFVAEELGEELDGLWRETKQLIVGTHSNLNIEQ